MPDCPCGAHFPATMAVQFLKHANSCAKYKASTSSETYMLKGGL